MIKSDDIAKIRAVKDPIDPPIRQVKKVKRMPGTVTQTGEAPEGEEWDYAEHGAYWDTDDPDAIDPYGEAKEFHNHAASIKEIANQVVEDEITEDQTTTADVDSDEPKNSDVDDEINAALSKLTGTNIQQSEENNKQEKKKKRRKVKRRKK